MPAPHANFAASLLFGEPFLQSLLEFLYDAKKGVPPFSLSAAGINSGRLFVGMPRVRCLATNDTRLEIAFRAWGKIAKGKSTGQHSIFADVVFTTPVSATPNGVRLKLAFDSVNTRLESLTVTAVSGGAFSQDLQASVESPELQKSIEGQFKGVMVIVNALLPELPLRLLGNLTKGITSTQLRMVDGALCIGVDVFILDNNTFPLSTVGDASRFVDDRRGSQFAAWIHPAACSTSLQNVTKTITDVAASQGGQLLLLMASPFDGVLILSMVFDMQSTTVRTTVGLRPRVPSDPSSRDVVALDVVSVLSDIEPPGWLRFLQGLGGVFALGIPSLWVENSLAMLRESIRLEVSHSVRKTPVGANFNILLDDGSRLETHFDNFSSHAHGLLFGASIAPSRRAGRLYVLLAQHIMAGRKFESFSILVDEILTRRFGVELRLPFGVLSGDPHLRVSWIIRRADTNAVIAQLEEQPKAKFLDEGTVGASFDLKADADAQELILSCRLFRVHGAHIEELFGDTRRVRIEDRIDRSHPYVRWSHYVTVPVVRVMPDGTRLGFGSTNELRESAIHKTRVPGRCRMVSRFSGKVSPMKTPGQTIGVLDYLDALPFPDTEIQARRRELCDYCFFGGPTKTVLL